MRGPGGVPSSPALLPPRREKGDLCVGQCLGESLFRVGLDLGVRYADDLEAQFLQEELSFAVAGLLFWVVVHCAVYFEDELKL